MRGRPALLVAAILVAVALGVAIALGVNGGVVLLLALAFAVGLAAALSKVRVESLALVMWMVLVAHRAFSLRAESLTTVGAGLSGGAYEVVVTTLVTLVAVLLVIASISQNNIGLPTGPMRLAWLYSGVALVSIVWSPNPAYAVFWACRLVAACLLVWLAVSKADEAGLNRLLLATALALVPYSILVIMAFESGFAYTGSRLAGFWLHPGIASIASFGVLVLSVGMLRTRDLEGWSRLGWWVALIVSGVGGFLAGGKAGAVGGAVGLAALVVLLPSTSGRLRAAAAAVISGLGIAYASTGLSVGLIAHVDFYERNVGLGTLYGRFDLWSGTVSTWFGDIFTILAGRGFTSSRALGIIPSSHTWVSDHAHNSFLQTGLENGLLGLLLMGGAVCWATWGALLAARKSRRPREIAVACALLVVVIGAMTDNVFGGLLLPPAYLLIALLAVSTRERVLALTRECATGET